ncbi:MAG TPA: ThiF family adenylyltransferase [Alphaproteobacteria bacterium]|nr:ThiF family adenylyltransferase [Alphaproteobacteria bacterium]
MNGASPSSAAANCKDDDEPTVFEYPETASGRVGIGQLTALLNTEKVGIIGTGGTGAYILDFVSKTPVQEIRLIDGDEFLTHNAFRAPGAASLTELREVPKKVDYLKAQYANMRSGIVAHPVALDESNLHLLDGLTFVFICIDGGRVKKAIIDKLESMGVSFIDVGMGINVSDDGLGGIVQITASTPDNREEIRKSVSLADDAENLYATNIQIAELNALNAAMAVIKWKKLRAFYRDYKKKHHSSYTIDTDQLEDDE